MSQETESISRKTWARSLEPVAKIGYMDGASDGQTAVFQQSFDVGYEQGLSFGLELGYKEAYSRLQQQRPDSPQEQPKDQCKINCLVCLNGAGTEENIGNLFNRQKEKNCEYLLNK